MSLYPNTCDGCGDDVIVARCLLALADGKVRLSFRLCPMCQTSLMAVLNDLLMHGTPCLERDNPELIADLS